MPCLIAKSTRGAIVLCLLLIHVVHVFGERSESGVLIENLPSSQVRAEGQEVLFTCIARNSNNDTVIWKYGADKILTAGNVRVTSKKNVEILHDEGGSVYVLSIKNLTPTDSGLYMCEINTQPPTRSFYKLTVISSKLTAPDKNHQHGDTFNTNTEDSTTNNSTVDLWGFATPNPINHDYTSCCLGMGVSEKCLGFCDIRNILEGKAGQNPAECEEEFPDIVMCMADGRNHVPCCEEARIPDICQDMCSGAYTRRSDALKTHLACSQYTAPTLACIAEGISILPGRPEELEAVDLGSNSFTLKWRPAGSSEMRQDHFKITLETLGRMKKDNLNRKASSFIATETFTVSGEVFEYPLTGLKPFTLYNATITAINKFGESLPSYDLLVVTHVKGDPMWTKSKGQALPALPDFQSCCQTKNISHASCADRFCNFEKVQEATIPDLMVCAPWTGSMFDCLFDGQDHTQCCQENGLPDVCLGFCSGTIKSVDFRHFKCMEYIAGISKCIMKKHDVLTSAPLAFRFSNIGTTIGLLHWEHPKVNGDNVKSYLVHYRQMLPRGLGQDIIKETKHNMYIFEDLMPDSSYESYVEAVNQYGVGEPSPRIVFRTKREPSDAHERAADIYKAHSQCCIASGLREECLPLCSYNVTMSDVKSLGKLCVSEVARLTQCAAGGRDHMPCCARRGVPIQCQPLCQGIQLTPHASTLTSCMAYAGNILTCLEEGSLDLPEPVFNLHALFVGNDSVSLEWDHYNETGDITQYEVYYKMLQNNSNSPNIFTGNQNVNVSGLSITIDGLEGYSKYQFFAVARNHLGTSLPSSVVTLSTGAPDSKRVNGVPTPPFSVLVTGKGSDFISLSQYIIHLTTKTINGESEPSETLVVWTNPIIPAYAEAPTIHPKDGILEGDSVAVLCIAMGSPKPNLTLYIAGHPIRMTQSRHMVTTIHNISRHMDRIACHADNGFGTPMLSSRQILIERGPNFLTTPPHKITAKEGQPLVLDFHMDASPFPEIRIGKNGSSVRTSDRFQVKLTQDEGEQYTATAVINITSCLSVDSGDYYIKINNSVGSLLYEFTLQIDQNLPQAEDSQSCCVRLNVAEECRDLCSLSVDLDFLIAKPQCFSEFDKLMECAADGSDHRHCCSMAGVPKGCLDWCRGIQVEDSEFCALTHARDINYCFKEGKYTLPGAPRNIEVTPISSDKAKAKWDPPAKNPNAVELYRVLYRRKGERFAEKIDTPETEITLTNLLPGVPYELVVKAGNSNGTSQLSPPLQFFTANQYVVETTQIYSPIPSIIGVLVALCLLIPLIILSVWYFKTHKTVSRSSSSAGSFDNPFFNQEMYMNQLEDDQTSNPAPTMSGSNEPKAADPSSQNLEDNERNPTLYEEIKLGKKGEGFKRLT
ncbi:hypothetical protein TCAL_04329 [Tigriopus californicus]|uniref:Ig-like and fibronectin type-III domain-containing protein C25G4.10 n=1 Tax=Tigriopus californicus TaxID=6832 RepID=A0A553PT26_TIGCA|nr:hypothetical protein TCAL_04329 [Tigriopus californicus]|eukprot:TCALIF_04329-PA protein Name:"Similar to C25G4.10 Ig-like and fibronectin type-III domain-containing protein C25G4.10 (Caenorhabditis elegans)" AED:0.05 eAED:0.05 QI:134/0.94/0.9/1/0.84/0.8/20/83/1384